MTIQAPPETLDAKVPNLILQPLVENAIRHGIGNRTTAGTIRVEAAIVGKQLRLQVSDDGSGTEKTVLPLPKKGIGLSNTVARLRQLYGTAQSFQLANSAAGGLLVTIVIPLQFA